MGKILRVDASGSYSWLEWDLSSSVDEAWLTFDLYLPARAVALWTASGAYAALCNVIETSAGPSIFLGDNAGGWWYWTDGSGEGGNSPAPNSIEDEWVTVELHVHNFVVQEIYIGGAVVSSNPLGLLGAITKIKLGHWTTSVPDWRAVSFYNNVKLGTTRGASDIFSDDFESGDLSAWTSVHGDCTVVGDGAVSDISHAVTYDGNGADGGTAPVDGANPYAARARVTVLDQGDLTKTGYVFIGWNTRADGSGASYTAGQRFSMPARDYVLYAQWKAVPGEGETTYAVTYDGNGADGGTAPVDAASPYSLGAAVSVLDQADLTKTGYAFGGWNTASDGGGHAFEPGQRFAMPGEDVAFFAQWALASTLTIRIYDLGVTELADISGIALEKSMPRLANGPRAFTVIAPANDPLLTDLAGDGQPILGDGGTRKLVVWENSDPETDDPIFHGRIFGCERDSDENARLVTITAFDPWVELGFEADERGGRILRDSSPATRGDQSFLTLHFESSVEGQSEISGPDLIRQALTYCQGDPTTDPIQGAGPLPIDIYSGEWDLDVPDAINLDPADTLDFPIMVGDFIVGLIDTNVVDFDLRPIRPGAGRNPAGDLDDYIMVEASAKSKLGTDRTATVHFDHLTGSYNARGAKETTDFAKQNSHLWYELGPRLANEKWRAVLQPHDQPLHADLLPLIDAAAAYFGGPNDPPGYNEFIRVFDSLGNESSSRPLYEALYRYEILYRLYPRKLLYITPCDGDKALFQAPQHFDAFDLIGINVGPDFGKTITAEAQRCYGYTKTWTRENVASLGQLLTSADVG